MIRIIALTLVLTCTRSYAQSTTPKPAPVLEITSMKDYKELCQQNKPIVIMFYAPWCGACTSMKEPFNEVASRGEEDILVKVNIDNPETKSLKDALGISAVPTFVTRQTGAMQKEALSAMVNGHIPPRSIAQTGQKPSKK